jgi:cation diffusion facilitator CzcD-associated flavoprotein CzcO
MLMWWLSVLVSSRLCGVCPTLLHLCDLSCNLGAEHGLRAGWNGLATAKTYLEVHPDAKLIVLDAQSSVGGVWAESRLYPGLKSNNMVGTYEYSDLPMDEKTWGVKPGEHIPGKVVHDYLTRYAEKFGVLPHIRFNAKVESAERGEKGGWLLNVGQQGSILAKKLIVATGMTSQEFVPTFQGQESFGVPLFHSKDFSQHVATVDTAKSVTILGGTKSAWDAVYVYASKGVQVNWVIRGTLGRCIILTCIAF